MISAGAKTKRILIVNGWGGNRGDEAMLNALYRIVHSIDKDIEVEVLPFRREEIDILHEMHVVPGKYGVDYYSDSSLLKNDNGGIKIIRKLSRGLAKALSYLGVLEQGFLRGYDLVLSAPQGPTISDMYGLKYQTLYPLHRAQRAGIPYAILGVSMGPFEKWTLDQHFVHRVLEGARRILVREDISLSNVSKKFPGLHNIDSAIDIVFADQLWKSRPMVPGSLLEQWKSEINPGAIGACISLTPARDPRNQFDREAYVQKMVELFKHIRDTTGRTLYLFPHLAFDLPMLQQMRSALGNTGTVILPQEFDSDDQRHLMSKMEFFVSSRYHPTIFAIQTNLPFLCIKNQFKVVGMLEKIGLGEIPTCWQDESLDVLKRTFDACWYARDTWRQRVASASCEAAKASAKYQSVLTELLTCGEESGTATSPSGLSEHASSTAVP